MECNKDEALRAKDIAVKKFEAMDITGAKRFAVKAQNLFATLEGIGQMITTLDVYLAAEQKVKGEKDWYAILSVDASVDEDSLKKQFRRLALQLHPDKNKSVGAEGAFQLISEAWNVLSDKSKRSLYNQKINIKGFQQKPFCATKNYSAPKTAASASAKTGAPKNTAPPTSTASLRPNAAPPPKPAKSPTFWTTCPHCNSQYRYLRVYVNRNLTCLHCKKPFIAKDTEGLPNDPNSSVRRAAAQQNLNLNQNADKASCIPEYMGSSGAQKMPNSYRWGSFSEAAGSTGAAALSAATAQAANVFYQKYEHVVKGEAAREESETAATAQAADVFYQEYEHVIKGKAAREEAELHKQLNRNATAKASCDPECMGSSGSQKIPNLCQWESFSRTAGPASVSASSSADAQAANAFYQKYEHIIKSKSLREEAELRKEVELHKQLNASMRNLSSHNERPAGNVFDREQHSFLNVERPQKKRKSRGAGNDFRGVGTEQKVTGIGNVDPNSSSDVNSFSSTTPYSRRGATNPKVAKQIFLRTNIQKLLIQKAKTKVCNKLNEWKVAEESKSAEEERAKKKQKEKQNDKNNAKGTAVGNDTDQNMLDESKSICESAATNYSNEPAEPENEPFSIAVSDSDFHDFDKNRTENSFEGEQTWATYDDKDGMPRYYGLIKKVISSNPFKIRMAYLEPCSCSELGRASWVASGYIKTCGEFRIGSCQTVDVVNIFSHRVRCDKGPRGVIKIIPRRGDIWALYKNWSLDWNKDTPKDLIEQYDMVEVLEDYNEEQGVPVAPLLKVSGFKTVFHPHLDPMKVKKIPREEMFRFSHQVPSIVLTGDEANNALKGCYELDPAATPLNLLQVITEAKDGEVIKISDQQPVKLILDYQA